ncbi:hypothetical protein CEW89_05825 [Celeribacter ethanolicus]|uniref:Uncharacterized protein n=1 Tax=Celeribacter ethanolicus TaxID=1758178 RepID=A0A291G9A1_9RHOB|nr:hypothetical protein CEW89_05825 [Celeribacter ethanolicus]
MFSGASRAEGITRPGNTIRKVYLCQAQSNLGPPGSVLFFYKGVSKDPPSQAITALGILESMTLAGSKRELMQLTGGRSVYSEEELEEWEQKAKDKGRPVKVINYLLVSYIEPAVSIDELKTMGVVRGHPQQSIYKLSHDLIARLIERADLEFEV